MHWNRYALWSIKVSRVMNCSDKYEKLSAYVDFEVGADCDLSETERLELELHISGCAECSQYVRTLTAAASELSRAAKVPLPADAAARLAALVDAGLTERGIKTLSPVEKSPARKADRGAWWRRLGSPAFATVAGGLAVVALAVVVWGSGGQTDFGAKAPAERQQESLSAPSDAPALKSRGLGAPDDSAPRAFTKADIRSMVEESTQNYSGAAEKSMRGAPAYDTGAAGEYSAPDSGVPKNAPPAPSADTLTGSDPGPTRQEAEMSADQAALIAAGGPPDELIQSSRGTFENHGVWVIIYVAKDGSGRPEGAAVTLDGKVVFRAR